MSVWRRLQRVGKKAAKFQFTVSFHELNVECVSQYNPGNLVVVWSRHSRRYTSKPFQCVQSTENAAVHTYVWTMPENLEFTTTLYRGAKALQFEEKEWVCQLEDVGSKTVVRLSGPSVRRRVLATRQVEMSEFAASIPTQTSLKINMRLASKKLRSATLLFTLHSVILKEGEATDEDMISLASLMSLSRTGSFNVGTGLSINDVGGIGAFTPKLLRYASCRNPSEQSSSDTSSFHQNLAELTAKFKALEQQEDELESTKPKATSPVNDATTTIDAVAENDIGNYRCSSSNPVHHSTVSLPTSAEPMCTGRGSDLSSKAASTRSGQDLLSWCQEVTQSYGAAVQINDLTTSFQSGVAFCAILHHFYPDKIDFDKVLNNSPVENCRLAFDVASKLDIPRVLDPAEMTSTVKPPDFLSVMTYLHQIRTRCSAELSGTDGSSSAPCDQFDNASRMSSPLTKRVSSSSELSTSNCTSTHLPTTRLSRSGSHEETSRLAPGTRSSEVSLKTKDPSAIQYEHMLAKARVLLQQTRSSSRADALPPLVNTHKPRPLSSASVLASSPRDSKPNTEIPSPDSHSLGKQKANQHSSARRRKPRSTLLRFNSDGTISLPNGVPNTGFESTSPQLNGQPPCVARHGSCDLTERSSTDGVKVKHLKLSQLNLFAAGKGSSAPSPIRIGEHHFNQSKRESQTSNSLQSSPPNGTTYRYTLVDSKAPAQAQQASGDSQLSCLQNELDELDQAQRELDEEAAQLEPRLRQQMTRSPGSAAAEQLLQRWFIVVNRKNALIHREHQLGIMEKEDELRKRTQAIQEELRQVMTMEDFLKTENDRRREETLLRQLVKLIEERDEMVKELDRQEKILSKELKFERTAIARTRFASRDRLDKCVLQ